MKVCGQADAEEPRDLTDRIPLGATFADACRHTVNRRRGSWLGAASKASQGEGAGQGQYHPLAGQG
jgi:hypothetical protein